MSMAPPRWILPPPVREPGIFTPGVRRQGLDREADALAVHLQHLHLYALADLDHLARVGFITMDMPSGSRLLVVSHTNTEESVRIVRSKCLAPYYLLTLPTFS